MTLEQEPAYAVAPEPVGGPRVPGRGRRQVLAAVGVAVILVGAVAAVLVATGRLGPPSKPPPRIAFVGLDGSLTLVDGQGGNRVDYPFANITFGFPAWSPDGSHVAVIATAADNVGVDVFAAGATGATASTPTVVYESATDAPFYLYWSPDSREVTFLTSNVSDISLRSAPFDGSAAARVLREGQPMYWAWDGPGRMLVHTGSDTDAFLGAVGTDGATQSTIAGAPGVFRAPAVSADTAYEAYVTAGSGGGGAVVVAKSDGSASHQFPVFGPAAVGFAPSGSQVAFIGASEGDRPVPLPVGPLRVVDASTGNVRTLLASPVVGFFWSPDGRTIATLNVSTVSPPAATRGEGRGTARLASFGGGPATTTAAQAPGAATADPGVPVALTFVDVATGAATTPVTVSLTSLFVNQLLPYFDQYALSHRVWSPDGTSILLPIAVNGVQTLEQLPKDGSAARPLGPGWIGFWSP